MMLRELLAALLFGIVVAVVAHAQVSRNLTINVGPVTGPTVPAAASSAGFTTLLLNMDFENNQVCRAGAGQDCATGGGTRMAASPVSNWMECSNVDTSKIMHNVGSQKCEFFIGTDPADGKSALVAPYRASWGGGNVNNNLISSMDNAFNGHGPGTPSFPDGHYFEGRYRLDTTWASPGLNILHSMWEYQYDSVCGYDLQTAELYTQDGGNSAHGAGNSDSKSINGCDSNGDYLWVTWQPPLPIPGWDPLDLHTYAGISSTNGNDSIIRCVFIDNGMIANGHSQGCLNLISTRQPSSDITPNERTYIAIGPGTLDSGSAPRDSFTYFHWIRVWTCANGATGQCTGSTMTGHLHSGNSADVAYWHN